MAVPRPIFASPPDQANTSPFFVTYTRIPKRIKEEFLVRKTRRESAYDEMRLRQEAERRRREEEAVAEAEAARHVL